MRRALVLAVLLGMMFGLRALKVEGAAIAGDPLTLAAIGFVVLAAYTVAEGGAALKLPRVTGFIVAGVVLGPSVLNVLSQRVVAEMQMFNTLALGLIALGAGLELDARTIARLYRTLSATIAVKVLLGLALVGGTLILIETLTRPLGLGAGPALYAVTLVIATLSIGTSPAIALAIMKETGAKGRLMDLVLGAAVLKDLVVVVALAAAIAVARTLIVPGAEVEASLLLAVGKELGLSIAAGGALGLLLIVYLRFVKAEMLLFVAAMILLTAEIAQALHLELLLEFITAGFVVRNLSKYEHELMDAISMVSLPVFVVFFTIAGAAVDLRVTWTLLPLALALCLARAATYWVAAQVGGRVGGESAVVRRNAWLGYLPQAGVTLGLVGLAALQLPELAEPIRATGMAVVALNLLIGPVTLRQALRKAGEIAEAPESEPASQARRAASEHPPPDDESAARARMREALDRIDDQPLRELLSRLLTRLGGRVDTLVRDELEPWARALADPALSAVSESELGDSDALARHAERSATGEVAAVATFLDAAFHDLRAALRTLPQHVAVPLRAELCRVDPGDRVGLRWRKRGRRLRALVSSRARQRRVAARACCRVAFEARLASYAAQQLGACARFQGALVEELRQLALGNTTAEVTREQIGRRVEALLAQATLDATGAISRGASEAASLLRRSGSPALPASAVRYTTIEEAVRSALASIHATDGWQDGVRAAHGALGLSVGLSNLSEQIRGALERWVLEPLAEAVASAAPEAERTRGRLEALRAHLPHERRGSDEELEALAAEAERLLSDEHASQLDEAFKRFRATLSHHSLTMTVRGVIDGLPEEAVVPHHATPLHEAANAEATRIVTVEVRALATELLVQRWLARIDEHLRLISATLSSVEDRLGDAVTLARDAISTRREVTPTRDDESALAEEIDRAIRLVSALHQALTEEVDEARRDIALGLADALVALRRGEHQGVSVGARGRLVQAAARFRELAGPILARAAQIYRGLARLSQGWVRDGEPGGRQPLEDAAGVRAAVDRWLEPAAVPQAYARLFRLLPLREHRWFVARRAELDALADAERRWLEGGPSSLLVVGDDGSGKSSLLNIAQLELTAPRVVSPSRLQLRRQASLLRALAYELGCNPGLKTVRRALVAEPTTVLVDDLERWFSFDDDGIAALEELLELVIATRGRVFWMLSIGRPAFVVLSEILPLRHVFSRLVTLAPLDADSIATVIESRHQASGRELTYPRTIASRFLGRFKGTSDRSIYFRFLAGVSGGNLAAALTTWLQSIEVSADGAVAPELARTVAAGMPLGLDLAAEEMAVVTRLLRFGPAESATLARELYLSRPDLDRHLSFLREAGIVEQPSGRRMLQVPAALRSRVVQVLRSRGAWS